MPAAPVPPIETSLRQGLPKRIFQLPVSILLLFGAAELVWTIQGDIETGFGEKALGHNFWFYYAIVP